MEWESLRASDQPEGDRLSFEPADVYLIDDLQGFELLSDVTRIEVLELCREPQSAKEMAASMGVPRTRLYHHIGMLEEAGMLVVVDSRKAGALTEKVYQVAAMSFQPSEAFSKSADQRQVAEAMLTSIMGATRADFLRALENGRFSMEKDDGPNHLVLGRRLMRLAPAHLDELISELDALFEKYSALENADDATPVAVLHIVHPSSREVASHTRKTVVT